MNAPGLAKTSARDIRTILDCLVAESETLRSDIVRLERENGQLLDDIHSLRTFRDEVLAILAGTDSVPVTINRLSDLIARGTR